MPVIFISYRRSDSQDVTGRVYDRLVAKFTPKQVYIDVDNNNIPLGVSFPARIKQLLGKANVVLVIIGPSWVNATNEEGVRRLDDENDFVRMEVEIALRANMPVIPVLVSNACMPAAADLPPSMHKLLERQGIPVRPGHDFNNDMVRLFSGIDYLDERLKIEAGKKKGAEPIKVVPIPWVIPVEEKFGIEVVDDAPSARAKRSDSVARRRRVPASSDAQEILVRLLLFAMGGGFSAFIVIGGAFTIWAIVVSFTKETTADSMSAIMLGLFCVCVAGAITGFPCGLMSGCLPAKGRHPISLAVFWALIFSAITLPFIYPYREFRADFLFPLGIAASSGAAFGAVTGLLARLLEKGKRGYLILLGLLTMFVLVAIGSYGGVNYDRGKGQESSKKNSNPPKAEIPPDPFVDKKSPEKIESKPFDSGTPEADFSRGVAALAKDPVQAAEWYRKAADRGHAGAQNNLGLCYETGNGVVQDLSQAVALFRKAADQKQREGQVNLGRCYENGNGVAKDLPQALALYRKAADQNQPEGMFYLGRCYENGIGTPPNRDYAIYWYGASAKQGIEQAKVALKNLETVAPK
jgi:hypothetical protein